MANALRAIGAFAGMGAGSRFYFHDWLTAVFLFGTALCCFHLATRETTHD